MKGFMEEGAWTSCSFDLGGKPREMQKSSDRLVTYSCGDRLITVDDKTTLDCFSCKSPAKFWGGLAAFIGGFVLGAALVLSGPVGWIAAGALIAVAVTVAVAVITHDCSDPQEAGDWTPFHETVIINRSNPILYQYSILACSKGGLLIASESQQDAQDVSNEMKWNTRSELGTQLLSQAFYGFASGAATGLFGPPSIGSVIYGGVVGTVFYCTGESENEIVARTGKIIEWTVFNCFIDKYKALYDAVKDVPVNFTLRQFGKAFAKQFLPGFVVSLGTTLMDEYFVNKIEEYLEEENQRTIQAISNADTDSSNKSILSITH